MSSKKKNHRDKGKIENVPMKDIGGVIEDWSKGGRIEDGCSKYPEMASNRGDGISDEAIESMVKEDNEFRSVDESLSKIEISDDTLDTGVRNLRKNMRASTMAKLKVLASVYDPTSIKNTIDRAARLGYAFSKSTVISMSKNPYFIHTWQTMLRPLVSGDIAKVADIQATLTSIMLSGEERTADRIRAAEVMGKFLHAFDNTLNVTGQISVLAGVVTGVPRDGVDAAVRSGIKNKVNEDYGLGDEDAVDI